VQGNVRLCPQVITLCWACLYGIWQRFALVRTCDLRVRTRWKVPG